MEIPLVTAEMRRVRGRYRLTVTGAMSIYVLLIALISGWLGWEPPQSGWTLYVWSVVPALPIGVVIFAIGRYLEREPDEFYRMIQIRSMILAGGLTMLTSTAWGFLALYAHVWERHMIAFVFAMFCGWMGIATHIVKWRYR